VTKPANKIFADRREMTEALDNAVDRERRNRRVGILQQRQAGLGRTDFTNRGGERPRQQRAAGNGDLGRGLAGGDQVDQIVRLQQWRARQNRQRDIRLVGGQSMHDHQRRLLRGREYIGQRAAHQRRRIVEQHDHRAFGGGEIVGR
jgi:hypothetical protein